MNEDSIPNKEVQALRGQVVEWTIYILVEVTKSVDRNRDGDRP